MMHESPYYRKKSQLALLLTCHCCDIFDNFHGIPTEQVVVTKFGAKKAGDSQLPARSEIPATEIKMIDSFGKCRPSPVSIRCCGDRVR